MKNKTLTKFLSAILAVVMVLCSAPLSGFVGLKFPDVKLPDWNLFDFAVDAEAATYSGTCGENVYWSLDTETGVLDITGTGAMKNYNSSLAPWYSYRSYVKSVNIQNGVTSIGSDAFWNCDSLTSVTIPDSVTSIGASAFEYCTSLTSVTIGDSVTSIDSYAFSGCTSLTSVTIGDSVTSIDYDAFYYCTNLTDVYYNGDIESWCGITFGGYRANPMCYAKNFYIDNILVKEIVIPDTVTEIKDDAFISFEGVTSITIPDSVTSIGYEAFSGCTSLTSITIPDSVTSIGNSAFRYCKSLTSVTIPDSVTSIGNSAFEECTGLARVYYNGDIESWCGITFGGYRANPMCYAKNFYINNTLVKEIVIPDTVTEIKDDAFLSFEGVTSVIIPDSVMSIGEYAFSGCTNLVSVTIGDSVTSIGDSVFYDCTNLTDVYYNGDIESWCNISFSNFDSTPMYYAKNFYINNILVKEIVIPDTVTEIKQNTFYGFEGVTSVSIPDSVTRIGYYAFRNCTSLESVTIGKNVRNIFGGAFEDCTSLTDVYYTGDISSWCSMTFQIRTGEFDYSYDTNPLRYAENFYVNGELTENIIIPEGITAIKENIFYNYDKLKSVTIPKSVITIYKNAFYSCSGIETVYYEGTEAEWEEIAIYDGNDSLKNAKKVFLNGGHEHVYNSSVTTEPTCTETGVKTFKCSCGETYTESIPALGHTWGNWIVTLEPTSTTDGRKVRSCTACNNAVEEELIPKTGYGELYSVRIDDLTLVEGSTNNLNPSVSYYGDISYSVSYSSSDKTVAIVDAEGTVAALNAGTSTITCKVTANDGTVVSDTCTVTVTKKNADKPETPDNPDEPETKLSVTVSDLAMNYKSTAKLSPAVSASGKYTVEYTSSDESVVTVDKDGNVVALGEGNAEITVTVTDTNGNTVKDTCKVTVTVAWWQWIIKILLLGFLWY